MDLSNIAICYGFLIPRTSELSGSDFAALIRGTYDNKRADYDASLAAQYIETITRKADGTITLRPTPLRIPSAVVER